MMFEYRVPGPIRPEVREALDDRYGPRGWTHRGSLRAHLGEPLRSWEFHRSLPAPALPVPAEPQVLPLGVDRVFLTRGASRVTADLAYTTHRPHDPSRLVELTCLKSRDPDGAPRMSAVFQALTHDTMQAEVPDGADQPAGWWLFTAEFRPNLDVLARLAEGLPGAAVYAEPYLPQAEFNPTPAAPKPDGEGM